MAARDKSPPQRGALDLRAIETVLGYTLRRAQALETALYADTVGRSGVRPVQFTLLLLIRDNPGVRAIDLARVLDIRRANMVALIQELETQGWVVRRADARDGRAQSLHLAPAGTRRLKRLEQDHQVHQQQLLERMGAQDLARLVGLLQKLVRPAGRA